VKVEIFAHVIVEHRAQSWSWSCRQSAHTWH